MAKTLTYKSKMDAIRKDFADKGGISGDNKTWFKVKEPERGQSAKANIRILPPWGKSANGFFYYDSAQHFGVSIGGRNRAISCLEYKDKGKCPVCIFINRLKGSGDKDQAKLAERLRKNPRFFVNIIDRDDEDKGIQLFGTNKKCIEAVLDASDDSDIGDITDPESGRNLIITRRGTGMLTRYAYRVSTKESSIEYDPKELYQLDKDVDEWMDEATIIKVLRDNFSEELKEVGLKFKHVASEDDEQPLKLVKKGKKVEEEEEDDDSEGTEDDTETEDVQEEEEDEDAEVEEDSEDEEDE